MTNRTKRNQVNTDDLRDSLITGDFDSDLSISTPEVTADQVDTGRIFGLTAGERMILSMILFLAVLIFSIALLLATGTIILP